MRVSEELSGDRLSVSIDDAIEHRAEREHAGPRRMMADDVHSFPMLFGVLQPIDELNIRDAKRRNDRKVFLYPSELTERIGRVDEQPIVIFRTEIHVQGNQTNRLGDFRRVKSAAKDRSSRSLVEAPLLDPNLRQAFVEPGHFGRIEKVRRRRFVIADARKNAFLRQFPFDQLDGGRNFRQIFRFGLFPNVVWRDVAGKINPIDRSFRLDKMIENRLGRPSRQVTGAQIAPKRRTARRAIRSTIATTQRTAALGVRTRLIIPIDVQIGEVKHREIRRGVPGQIRRTERRRGKSEMPAQRRNFFLRKTM